MYALFIYNIYKIYLKMSFNFQPNEEYLFVNHILKLMYGKIPSYAAYQDNSEISFFWNSLSKDEDNSYEVIYN